MINGIGSFLLVCISLFYHHKLYELRIEMNSFGRKYEEKEDIPLYTEDAEEHKYKQIYRQIEEYFECNQPYLDPDFKITKMAHELSTNIVYLAKAIRLTKEMNFNNFVNAYRVEKVKELMHSDSRKYTLKYIYLSSGFKNQSSFNKAFKLKEGITPSEYYKQNKMEKDA